jgi:hypothetical protein
MRRKAAREKFSGTVLAGLIGGAASKLLTPAEHMNLVRSLDTARADMDAHASPRPGKGVGEPVESFAPPLIPEPTVGFHGSPVAFTEFNKDGPYFFSPHADVASSYAISSEAQTLAVLRGEKPDFSGNQPHVVRAALKMERPFEALSSDLESAAHARDMEWLRANGYDSAILRDPRDPKATEFVVLDRSQIQTGLGVAHSAGAAATDIRTLEMPSSIPGTKNLSVTRRTLEAESVVARRAMADTAETPYSYKQSVEGVAAYQGPPVDRIVKMTKDGTHYEVGQELDRLFTQYRFGQEAPSMARMRAGIDDMLGRSEGKMSFGDFKKQVSEAAMFGDQHAIPEVAQAAQYVRAKVLEPWAARAETAIEGFKRSSRWRANPISRTRGTKRRSRPGARSSPTSSPTNTRATSRPRRRPRSG